MKWLNSLLWAVAFLVASFLLLEVSARVRLLRKILPDESIGVYPTPMGSYFEIKWYRLQQYVAQNGGVDVILIGSSVVNTGLDPEVIAQTYFEKTGTTLRIFNFGVEGLDIVPNSVYAKILVEKYHPALLIFGTLPRDYLADDNAEVNHLFLSSPWIKYQSGDWNFPGFLIAHSQALRHLLAYRNWMRSDYTMTQYKYHYRIGRESASGYEPDNYIATNLDQTPDPGNPDDAAAFDKYRNYQMDPARLQDLQDILNLQKEGKTQVIVLDMPMHSTFYDYMGGKSAYEDYQNVLQTTVSDSGSLFIPASGEPVIPPDGRSDRTHLNQAGAPVMSVFLGEQLAALTKNNGMQFIRTDQGGK